MYKKTIIFSIILAFIVVVVGAYTRLTDSGLGCPDWPGCYGQLIVPNVEDGTQISGYDRPVETKKGWIEMIHRYIASLLGLLILAIFLMSFINKSTESKTKIISAALLLLVIFQGILGMLTVTELVHPIIVSMHLFGGFATTSLLFWLWLSHSKVRNLYKQHILKRHKLLIVAVLLLLLGQIFLGVWTSTNYASLACGNSLLCSGSIWPENMDFQNAFFIGELNVDYEFGVLSNESRVAIQTLHKIGAIVLSLAIVFLIYSLKHYKALIQNLKIMALLLTTQIALGIMNIVFWLPIITASLHNLVALLLVLNFLSIIYKTISKTDYLDL